MHKEKEKENQLAVIPPETLSIANNGKDIEIRLLKKLGSGKNADVFLYTASAGDEKLFAVKIPYPISNSAMLQEFQISKQIYRFAHLVEKDQANILVMPYLGQHTLIDYVEKHCIEQQYQSNYTLLVQALLALCDALIEMREKNYGHLDCQLVNVMYSGKQASLIDLDCLLDIEDKQLKQRFITDINLAFSGVEQLSLNLYQNDKLTKRQFISLVFATTELLTHLKSKSRDRQIDSNEIIRQIRSALSSLISPQVKKEFSEEIAKLDPKISAKEVKETVTKLSPPRSTFSRFLGNFSTERALQDKLQKIDAKEEISFSKLKTLLGKESKDVDLFLPLDHKSQIKDLPSSEKIAFELSKLFVLEFHGMKATQLSPVDRSPTATPSTIFSPISLSSSQSNINSPSSVSSPSSIIGPDFQAF